MSFLAIHQAKGAAHVLMDTGAVIPDGTPTGFCSKALVIPHLNCLFTLRGLSCFAPAFLQCVQQAGFAAFDDLATALEPLARETAEHVAALADADLIAHWSADLLDAELTIVGWSDRLNRVRVLVTASRLDFRVLDVTSALECSPSLLRPDDIPANVRRMKDPAADLAALAKLQHQAALASGHFERDCRFGGGMTYFEVSRHGVTCKRLKSTFSDHHEFAQPAA